MIILTSIIKQQTKYPENLQLPNTKKYWDTTINTPLNARRELAGGIKTENVSENKIPLIYPQ